MKALMTQREMAEATGFTQSYIHYVLRSDRIPSVKNSIRFEQTTGICREAWLFPERHWNPYIPFSNSLACGSCANRIHRAKMVTKLLLENFDKTANKKENIKNFTEITRAFTGKTSGSMFLYREIFSDKLVLLGAGGDMRHGHDVLKGSRWQGLIDAVQKRGAFVVPHFPHDIPNDTPPESLILYIEDPRSYYRFSSGRHLVYFVVSSISTIKYTPEVTNEFQDRIEKLDELWHQTYYS